MLNRTKYKIEKGIPVPRRGTWSGLINQMNVGDSILFETHREAHSFRMSLINKGFHTKLASDENEKYRVWKMELR